MHIVGKEDFFTYLEALNLQGLREEKSVKLLIMQKDILCRVRTALARRRRRLGMLGVG